MHNIVYMLFEFGIHILNPLFVQLLLYNLVMRYIHNEYILFGNLLVLGIEHHYLFPEYIRIGYHNYNRNIEVDSLLQWHTHLFDLSPLIVGNTHLAHIATHYILIDNQYYY